MICSGEQTILIYIIKQSEAEIISSVISALETNRNGTLQLSPSGISFSGNVASFDHSFQFNSEKDWLYQEKTGYHNHLYIIGGGHCSLALSKIMSMLGFYIFVYDERKGLNTMEQNVWAHEKAIVGSYKELEFLIPANLNAFAVIMTIGYRTDAEALKALIGKEFRYLGLLGSKKKIEALFSDVRNENVPAELLQRVHSPIGIAIKSKTPEEIAISIAAEIIAVKNQ